MYVSGLNKTFHDASFLINHFIPGLILISHFDIALAGITTYQSFKVNFASGDTNRYLLK
jgi:hypothetical protein